MTDTARTFSSGCAFNASRFGLRRAACASNGATGDGNGGGAPDKGALCVKIADIIQDYRKGEIAPRTPEDVGKWISQFDEADQLPILEEMAHILERMYFSEAKVREFIRAVVSGPKLTGGNPKAFWRGAEILDLQREGSQSQRGMLALLDGELREICGHDKAACKGNGKTFVYLDDGIFSGGQATADIVRWLKENGQASGFVLHIVVIGLHDGGKWRLRKAFMEFAPSGGRIKFWWLRGIPCWRRDRSDPDKSGVLWPRRWPDDDSAVKEWLLRAPEDRNNDNDILRPEGRRPVFFKSENGRNVLEQAFLRMGADLYCRPAHRTSTFRPLGAQSWAGWGFGSLFLTYRNCPNNCPLVWWDNGGGWFPLFPRRHRGEG